MKSTADIHKKMMDDWDDNWLAAIKEVKEEQKEQKVSLTKPDTASSSDNSKKKVIAKSSKAK